MSSLFVYPDDLSPSLRDKVKAVRVFKLPCIFDFKHVQYICYNEPHKEIHITFGVNSIQIGTGAHENKDLLREILEELIIEWKLHEHKTAASTF